MNSTPFASSSSLLAFTSSTWTAGWAFFWGANSMPNCDGCQMAKQVCPSHTSAWDLSSGRKPSVST